MYSQNQSQKPGVTPQTHQGDNLPGPLFLSQNHSEHDALRAKIKDNTQVFALFYLRIAKKILKRSRQQ